MSSCVCINKTARRLAVFSIAMFGFGYLMVPLYTVFCDITGLNGKTGEISIQAAEEMKVDQSRTVYVEFDTNLRDLPWEFKPLERKVAVHPGELGEAVFRVKNNSQRAIVGRAIPSIAPTQASVWFDKTECFCFEEQTLEPGEELDMVVRFIIGTELPKRFGSLVLSYTFFEIASSEQEVANRTKQTNEDRS